MGQNIAPKHWAMQTKPTTKIAPSSPENNLLLIQKHH